MQGRSLRRAGSCARQSARRAINIRASARRRKLVAGQTATTTGLGGDAWRFSRPVRPHRQQAAGADGVGRNDTLGFWWSKVRAGVCFSLVMRFCFTI